MSENELRCANCSQTLDPSDKFCRECGLPTLRRAEAQLPAPAPDTAELHRALELAAEPRPFIREESADPPEAEPLHTSDVVRATNPTFTMNRASSTALMVGVIAVLTVVGLALIGLALWR